MPQSTSATTKVEPNASAAAAGSPDAAPMPWPPSWLASSTDRIAVPNEAPTCWLMLSVVEARAIAERRRVWMAPEKVGIIVAPMPRPSTNRFAPSSQ